MGICWYCYWGWSQPVGEIYARALSRLRVPDPLLLEYGPAHTVWGDENFDDGSISRCLEGMDQTERDLNRYTENDWEVVRWSLQELLQVPELIRDCEPENYDGLHPELFPPTMAMWELWEHYGGK